MKYLRLLFLLSLSVLMILTVCACSGGADKPDDTTPDTPGETDTPTQPGDETEAPTEPATDAETIPEDPTEPETLPVTEPVTEDPNAIPEVPDEVVGVANVAPQGFVMGSSSLADNVHMNVYLNDGTTKYGFSTRDLPRADAEAYVFIDLTRAYTIRSLVLYPCNRDAEYFPRAFIVEVSDDGVDYTVVKSVTGVEGVGEEGLRVDLGEGVSAVFLRLSFMEMNGKSGAYRAAIGEMEVLADVTRTTNLLLNQNDIWLYKDTSETLTAVSRRVGNTAENAALRFMSADESVVTVDHQTGLITPTGFGDTTVYAYDGENLTACRVRVIDDTGTDYRISTFYHSNFGYPEVIPQCLDYMKDAGIEFLEETRTYDAVGNQVCDYMMYLCAKRGIFYSVCDPLNSADLAGARDKRIVELYEKYKNRAGFGGIYLVDEPHEESNSYAHVASVIRSLDYHVTPHLNLLPGGFPSWEEYVSDYCAVAGGAYRMTYLSYDNYPFGWAKGSFNAGVYNTLNVIRKNGLKYNASTGFYMQAMEITGNYRIMTDTETLYNASIGVAYGMKNFKWFVYLTPIGSGEAFTTGLIGPDFTPAVMYNGVVAANARIRELGKVLADSDAVEVYHRGSVPGNEKVPDTFPLIQTTKNDAIYTLYVPISGEGRQYVVITNKDFSANGEHEFIFRLADDLNSIEVLYEGVFEEVTLSGNNEFGVIIPAGDVMVFRLPEGYDGRRPTEQHENLALDGAVFVSTSQYTFWTVSEQASFHLNDGNTTSGGWLSDTHDTAPYVMVDLKTAAGIGRVVLHPFVGRATKTFPSAFTISVSVDGESWTEVYATEDASTDGTSVWECVFDQITARYVRVDVASRTPSLGEIEVFAD